MYVFPFLFFKIQELDQDHLKENIYGVNQRLFLSFNFCVNFKVKPR
jgi:hypothetical protein